MGLSATVATSSQVTDSNEWWLFTDFDYNKYQKEGVEKLWNPSSPLLQLLEVADRFNLTKMVVRELKGVFGEIGCRDGSCFRCINIYLELVDGDETPIYRKFDSVDMNDFSKMRDNPTKTRRELVPLLEDQEGAAAVRLDKYDLMDPDLPPWQQ